MDTSARVVIGLLAAGVYGRWKKLPLRPTLDTLTPALATVAIGLGLAHLASGDAFGVPTSLPWAIYLWDENRHPSQVYEIIAAFAIFSLLWRNRHFRPFPGFTFLLWAALTAFGRLFLETFRGDSVFVAGGIRQAQLVALGILLLCLWLMKQWYESGKPVT